MSKDPQVPAGDEPTRKTPTVLLVLILAIREFKDALRKMFQPDKPKRKRKS